YNMPFGLFAYLEYHFENSKSILSGSYYLTIYRKIMILRNKFLVNKPKINKYTVAKGDAFC
ncbi:MAG: hypothetical protein IIW23_00385, partial [Clostridia bacterium]|nr:hypothetical protein [Clostridia bacterium]